MARVDRKRIRIFKRGSPDTAPPSTQVGQDVSAPAATAAADATTGRSVLRGGAWTVGSQIIGQFYTIAASVVAARFLGAAGLGRVTFISFVQTTVALVLAAGLPQAVMRYTAEALGRDDPRGVRALQRWAWRVAAVGAAIGATTLAAVGLMGGDPRSAWILAGIGTGAAIMHHIPSALLIAAQRWRAFTSISVVTGGLGMAGKIAALWAGGGIPSLFAVDAAVACINLIVAGFLARRTVNELSPSARPASELIHKVVRFAAVSSITVFLTFIVWRRTELFFLNAYSDDVQIALYSIPFSAVSALLLIPTALYVVVGPAFATLFGAGAMDRLRSGYGRAVRLTTFATLPVTALALALGPTLLTLVYGNEFAGTDDVLRILLVTFPIIPLMDISIGLLLGLGSRWPQVIVGAVAAVANISLDLLLIPRYDAVGAAIANSSAQLIGAVPIIIYANRAIGWTEWHAAAVLRTGLAAAASGGVAFLLLSLLPAVPGLITGTAAGLTCFVLLAFALRILPREDGTWLEHTLGGAFGGAVGTAFRHASARPSRAA